jgi:hypothetical protein
MSWGPAPRGRGRRYGHGRPGRRVHGYYRARPVSRGGRHTCPIPLGGPGGCLLPMLATVAAWVLAAARRRG